MALTTTTTNEVGKSRPAMGRTPSTVSFAATAVTVEAETAAGLPEDEEAPLVDQGKTRLFSVSKDRPIARIPTRADMKTLTHMARRPAVDIEFHDLTYAVNTTAGKYHKYRPLAPVLNLQLDQFEIISYT